jgi:hypothetical protein
MCAVRAAVGVDWWDRGSFDRGRGSSASCLYCQAQLYPGTPPTSPASPLLSHLSDTSTVRSRTRCSSRPPARAQMTSAGSACLGRLGSGGWSELPLTGRSRRATALPRCPAMSGPSARAGTRCDIRRATTAPSTSTAPRPADAERSRPRRSTAASVAEAPETRPSAAWGCTASSIDASFVKRVRGLISASSLLLCGGQRTNHDTTMMVVQGHRSTCRCIDGSGRG